MTRKKNKNVSKNVPNGLILHTRDEFFEGRGSYKKPGYENKGNYRKAVVIDSNKNDDLAVVKFVSSGTELEDTGLKYRPFVETKDDQDNAIRLSYKFIPSKKRVTKKQVNILKQDCFLTPNVKKFNKHKVRQLKNRR